MDLDFFKAEHAALLDLRQQLLCAIDVEQKPGHAATLRHDLGRVLLAHLAKEDAHLYPRLMQQEGGTALADHYQQETGDLAARWQTLAEQWPDARIASDRAAFREAARPVLDALADRILSEEQQLYPLLEPPLWPDAA